MITTSIPIFLVEIYNFFVPLVSELFHVHVHHAHVHEQPIANYG